MKIHILGIGGTFMAGIAQLARALGHEVTGSDLNIYPPMSTLLESQNIKVMQGYEPAHIQANLDCVIVGNVIRRGNPAMEEVMRQGLGYVSGPQWLAENVLAKRNVLAVSGTHGKTTTSSLLSWIFEYAGLNPGFLIGGIPENFGYSARLGNSPFFVIEADEYDSAFFDKRSKFLHYRPKTLILNNLEFDHADIFSDLDSIKQQFHYLIKTVPSNGLIIRNAKEPHLDEVIAMGCWTPIVSFGSPNSEWHALLHEADGSVFSVFQGEKELGKVHWNLLGQHNVDNALAAFAAAKKCGLSEECVIEALGLFKNVKRRLEIKGVKKGVTVYDDFAHHPTAIATTLAGLRAKVGKAKIISVLEFGSFTMRNGFHRDQMREALALADQVICKRPDTTNWNLEPILQQFLQPTAIYPDADSIVQQLVKELKPGDHVVVMSNSGFDGIHQKMLTALE